MTWHLPQHPRDPEGHLARARDVFAARRASGACTTAPPLDLGDSVLELVRMRRGTVIAIKGDRVTITSMGLAIVCACDAVIRRTHRRRSAEASR